MTIEWANVITTSVISATVSGLASFLIAKQTSRAELKKMKLTWERQDRASDETNMRNMFAYVSLWLHGDSPVYYEQALAQVSLLLGRYPDPLGQSLAALHAAVASYDKAQATLHYSKVVEDYRKHTVKH